MPCDLIVTSVSEEHTDSIFRVEKSRMLNETEATHLS
jgi:hypothetical protein